MDLLDLAILALRIALVAVLYGFVFVVLRAAGRGLRPARPVPQAAAGIELRLIVLEPGGSALKPGDALDVRDGGILGRADRAELVVADPAVSSEHAQVTRLGRDWVVRDLGSTNGTLVNDARLQGQTRLKNGDVLVLGGVRLKVALHSSIAEDRA